MKIEAVKKEDESGVTLDTYNSDLNLAIDGGCYSAYPLTNEGFAFMWAGARATHGISRGKCCFEAKVVKHLNVQHLPEDEPCPHVVRVGFSVDSSTMQLGEDPLSYGYGGTGKISTNCQFKNYGMPFTEGDVILAFVDMDLDAVQIGFAKNGTFFGWAFKVNKKSFGGKALFPHILTKNCSFEVNFGQRERPYFPWPDIVKNFAFINCFPVENRVTGSRPPASKGDCEVLMMCGLPGSGKSVWVEQYCKTNPHKKYNVLGTNNIIDKMKVMGLPRKRNYHGRWEVLIEMATNCINKMFKIASKLQRNYILDQTNVYPTAQRRKMQNFDGFQRIAVVIVPTDEDYKKQCDKRDREEGKLVPDSAVLEMKANFKIPVQCDVLDAVVFIRLGKEDAEKLVQLYNEEGKAEKNRFKLDRGNRGVFAGSNKFDDGCDAFEKNSSRFQGGFEEGLSGFLDGFEEGCGGFRGGFQGGFERSRGAGMNRKGYDSGYGGNDQGHSVYYRGNDGYKRGRGGYDRGRGPYDGGRGSYDGNRGGYDGGRGSYDGNSGSYDLGRGSYDGNSGSYDLGRGSYDGNRGSYDGGRGSYDGNRGSYDGGQDGYERGRGGYGRGYGGHSGGQGGFDKDSGGYNYSQSGYDSGCGSYDQSPASYESGQSVNDAGGFNRGSFNRGRGAYRGGQGVYDEARGRRRGNFPPKFEDNRSGFGGKRKYDDSVGGLENSYANQDCSYSGPQDIPQGEFNSTGRVGTGQGFGRGNYVQGQSFSSDSSSYNSSYGSGTYRTDNSSSYQQDNTSIYSTTYGTGGSSSTDSYVSAQSGWINSSSQMSQGSRAGVKVSRWSSDVPQAIEPIKQEVMPYSYYESQGEAAAVTSVYSSRTPSCITYIPNQSNEGYQTAGSSYQQSATTIVPTQTWPETSSNVQSTTEQQSQVQAQWSNYYQQLAVYYNTYYGHNK